jgi:uncharacterized membrane-anchored protein YitT (DUF2179 family)
MGLDQLSSWLCHLMQYVNTLLALFNIPSLIFMYFKINGTFNKLHYTSILHWEK